MFYLANALPNAAILQEIQTIAGEKMERLSWNFFLFIPGSFIIFVWDMLQNHGALFRLLTMSVGALVSFIGF
jgi:hypothetical protein